MDKIEELIDRYLSKSMTEVEEKDFEDLLKTDKTLYAEYLKSIAARKLIEEAGRLELKEKLETFENEEQLSKTRIIPLWIKRAMAMAAVLIVFFGLYQVVFNNSITADQVYLSYFEVYKAPSVARNSEVTLSDNLKLAMNAYDKKAYDEAVVFFNRVADKANYLTNFYKGLSYLSLKKPNYNLALKSFESVLQNDNDYNQQALWYKGLTLLKLGETNMAMEVFQIIKEKEFYNHVKAKEILGKTIKN